MSRRSPLLPPVLLLRSPARNRHSWWSMRSMRPVKWSPAARHGFPSGGKPNRHSKWRSRPKDLDSKLRPALRDLLKRRPPRHPRRPRLFRHRPSNLRPHLFPLSPSVRCLHRPRRPSPHSPIGRKLRRRPPQQRRLLPFSRNRHPRFSPPPPHRHPPRRHSLPRPHRSL